MSNYSIVLHTEKLHNTVKEVKRKKQSWRKRNKEARRKRTTSTCASRKPNTVQRWGHEVAWGRERGRFLVLLRMVYGRRRRESQEVRKEKPRLKTGSCCWSWSITSRKGKAVKVPWLLTAPWPPQGHFCSQHFGLKETWVQFTKFCASHFVLGKLVNIWKH